MNVPTSQSVIPGPPAKNTGKATTNQTSRAPKRKKRQCEPIDPRGGGEEGREASILLHAADLGGQHQGEEKGEKQANLHGDW
jgi:hypothetical protein